MNDFLTTEAKLMDAKEVAEIMNVKVSTVRQLCFKKQIPFIKIGRLVRFEKNLIHNWLRENISNCREFSL